MQRPQANWLQDGRRLHLHHGPIDMIVGIEGRGRQAGFDRAVTRFETLLDELVAELPRLRSPFGAMPTGETALRMAQAVAPFQPDFITPMAAVAGAGANTVLDAIVAEVGVEKAYVNNGGDVAFHLAPGQCIRAALAACPTGFVTVEARDPVQGIASSGWGGRSHSRGIADNVTVLASSAARADAAATMIANAVDLPGHPNIQRRSAEDLSPDSDLGARLVTVDVGFLSEAEIDRALAVGRAYALSLQTQGLVHSAYLTLQGRSTTVIGQKALDQKVIRYA